MVNRETPGRSSGTRKLPRTRRRRSRLIAKIAAALATLAVIAAAGLFVVTKMSDEGVASTTSSSAPQKATAKPDEPTVDYFYAKDTPYPTPVVSIKAPPAGYSMFFIENMGRHGSRSDTNDDAGKDMLKLWRKADDKNAVTKLGEGLKDDIETFDAAERSIGFGQESTRGKAEWKAIGQRTATNYREFFTAARENGDEVDVVTTPVNRTKVSMSAFLDGLTTKAPGLAVNEPVAEEDYINFRSSVSSEGYDDIDTIENTPEVEEAAANVLRKIFVPEYVDSLHGKVDKALTFYGLYSTAAGMSLDTDVTFHEYFALEDAAALSYARDAGTFYKYGPGIKGQNQTYKGANILRTAFFEALDDRINGGDVAAVFRTAHGETTIPFAALLQLPGSEKQAEPGVPFSYDNNPWRGAKVGTMAGNIEWVAYRNSNKDVLVTMRYNETPALFRAECEPVSAGSYFYTPDELKSCLPSS